MEDITAEVLKWTGSTRVPFASLPRYSSGQAGSTCNWADSSNVVRLTYPWLFKLIPDISAIIHAFKVNIIQDIQ
jgi:hypothetical protein